MGLSVLVFVMRNSSQSCPVTLVISEVVKSDRLDDYEAWTRGINQAARQFEGYLGTDIIRPRDHNYPEYVTIVKFDNYENFRHWRSSAVCQEWLENVQDLVIERTTQQRSGMELWFTLPKNASYQPPQPAYYKQVIVGAISVYPLILFTNATLGPFLKGLPDKLALFISVVFLSSLLTYPVMPWLTRALSFWLYPSVKSNSRKRRRN